MKNIIIYPLILFACAHYIPEPYWYSSTIKEPHGGHFKSTSDIPFVIIENSVILDSVQFPDSLFDSKSNFPYQINEFSDFILNGNEKYLFMYRNYMSTCCDSKDVGTIVFLIGINGENFDFNKSVILETGPWQLPHLVYWPKKISFYDIDNSMQIFAKDSEGKDYVFNGMISINRNWKLQDYFGSKKMLKEKL